MKRIHIHMGINNLEQGIDFYTALFGAGPSKTMPDYAKWQLEDPCLNFAISTRVGRKGVDHLGIQVDDDCELNVLRERLKRADGTVFDEGDTVCCYAHSDKSWTEDPSGVAWEVFRTMEDAPSYSSQHAVAREACCIPKTKNNAACCEI